MAACKRLLLSPMEKYLVVSSRCVCVWGGGGGEGGRGAMFEISCLIPVQHGQKCVYSERKEFGANLLKQIPCQKREIF